MQICLVIFFELNNKNFKFKTIIILNINWDEKWINFHINIIKIMFCNIEFHNVCFFEIIINFQSFIILQHKIFIFWKLFENNVAIKNIFLMYFYQHAVFILQDFHYLIERIVILDEIINHTDIDSEVKIIIKKYKILLSFLINNFFLFLYLI